MRTLKQIETRAKELVLNDLNKFYSECKLLSKEEFNELVERYYKRKSGIIIKPKRLEFDKAREFDKIVENYEAKLNEESYKYFNDFEEDIFVSDSMQVTSNDSGDLSLEELF